MLPEGHEGAAGDRRRCGLRLRRSARRDRPEHPAALPLRQRRQARPIGTEPRWSARPRIQGWHTGYPGGIRAEQYKKRLARKPVAIVEDAIVGMLPHTKLGRQMAKKLKVYRDDKHQHQAQKPEPLAL